MHKLKHFEYIDIAVFGGVLYLNEIPDEQPFKPAGTKSASFADFVPLRGLKSVSVLQSRNFI